MEKLSRRSKLTRKEFWRAIDSSPVPLSDAYYSTEVFDVMNSIGRRYKFNEDELWELYGLVYDVILGFLPPKETKTELEKRLKLDRDRAGFIQGEIDAFIFNHIRPELDKRYGGANDQKTESIQVDEALKKTYTDLGQDDPYRETIE